MLSFLYVNQCQIANTFDKLFSNKPDVIIIKHIPSVLHNDNVYITILYKCSSSTPRRISVSIRIDRTLYQTNFPVFRRFWLCRQSSYLKVHYVRIRLHRSIAYASDGEINLMSWPIEQGQLTVTMYKNSQANEREIIKKIEYNVRFLPVHKRPSFRSYQWNPIAKKPLSSVCLKEPGKII